MFASSFRFPFWTKRHKMNKIVEENFMNFYYTFRLISSIKTSGCELKWSSQSGTHCYGVLIGCDSDFCWTIRLLWRANQKTRCTCRDHMISVTLVLTWHVADNMLRRLILNPTLGTHVSATKPCSPTRGANTWTWGKHSEQILWGLKKLKDRTVLELDVDET